MTCSIYHFFVDLYQRRSHLTSGNIKPDKFTYRDDLLSLSESKGSFPDLAIRLNKDNTKFSGGELIEIKDSTSGYTVSSFNSTRPTGEKLIKDIAPKNKSSRSIFSKMEAKGDDVYSLKQREVYYLIRGMKDNNVKVCLIHGSFFDTLPISTIIGKSFEQAIDDAISASKNDFNNKQIQSAKKVLLELPWEQSHFSSVKRIPESAISTRYRMMFEGIQESNILNEKHYPEVRDNTLNLILPLKKAGIQEYLDLLKIAFRNMGGSYPKDTVMFNFEHKINSKIKFMGFQYPLK